MKDFAIVVQGSSNYVNEIKNCWKSHQIIFSTWLGEENKYKPTDICVFTKQPKDAGIQNLFLQQLSTLNGILKAKQLGFSHVIKWRSDMVCTAPENFIKLFTKNLNFLFWHNHNGGYICDYFMGGNIDLMLKLWSFDSQKKNYSFPEQAITDVFLANNKTIFDDYYFFGNLLTETNDVMWIKHNLKLSTYNQDSKFLTNLL